MPFLIPLSNGEDAAPAFHESNDCHNPGGPGGGQFCSKSGGQVHNASGREGVMSLITSSPKFDVGEAVTGMGPEFAAKLKTMMSRAPAAQAFLTKTLESAVKQSGGRMVAYEEITDGRGTRASVGPVKGERRIVEKAIIEEGGDLGGIKDLVRASIAVDSVEEAGPLLRTIKKQFDVIRVKDRFANPMLGYRDILLNIRTPDGTIGEIQIHVKAMLKAKETKGHKLYEQLRRAIHIPGMQDQVVSLQKQTLELYNHAWTHALSVTAAVAVARGALNYLPPAGRFA